MNVLKILVLGVLIYRDVRGSEASGGSVANGLMVLGGSAKEGHHVREGM